MSRILFFLLLIGVTLVYAQGQGWVGNRPTDEGRQPNKVSQELRADAVKLLDHKK